MSASAQNTIADFDALLDFSQYDGVSNHSGSLSPSTTSKPTFASPVTAAVATPSVASTTQSLNGPSHDYDLYRQHTGFVPGAIANTMALNETHNTGYQDFSSLEYMSNFSPENDLFDFNTSPSQGGQAASDMDLEFESPANTQNFFPTINPSSIEQDSTSPVMPSQGSSVGRLWPGAHSQAALAKAQAQQRQQQNIMMQQTRQNQQKVRGKAPQPSDPIVEQKITQLLNSMRAKPSGADDDSQASSSSLLRSKKEEEEMDEDERLLASEEGKKLSSKERRQLRNKVSARAFRSRRKEYITHLEQEINTKHSENGDLRSQNRALVEENKRLSDLTRMLLSSPSFSTFLDHLSTNPQALPQGSQQVKVEQQQEQRQLPKDVNPYGSQGSQQQIGMAMIPEQTMDFSMLHLDHTGAFNFQPQVFVVDTPEMSAPIDVSILSGKASNFVQESFSSEDEKVDVPVIERAAKVEAAPVAVAPFDEEFESDPEYALYRSEPASSSSERKALDTDTFSQVDIFGGIESEKMLSRYELVDATEEEATAAFAMARVHHISANIESMVSRLERLTMDF